MSREDDLRQLGAWADGELGLRAQLEIEDRIARDPLLQAEAQRLRELSAALRERADYHAAPAALRARLQRLPAARSSAVRDGRQGWRGWSWPGRPAAVLAGSLALLLAVALLAGGGQAWLAARHDTRLQAEVIAGHVRATLGQHLVDIASSDRHVVKPWLSARLDFSPPVPEPALPGLSFVGARIDYLDSRPVAALGYRLRNHVIDVFVWPDAAPDTAVAAAAERGFHVRHWKRGGMAFWAISDVNIEDLTLFTDAFARLAEPS
jgi:anti-sigma factor RsiW